MFEEIFDTNWSLDCAACFSDNSQVLENFENCFKISKKVELNTEVELKYNPLSACKNVQKSV